MTDRIRVIEGGEVIGSLPYRERADCVGYPVRAGRIVSEEEMEAERDQWVPLGYLSDPAIIGYAFAVVAYWVDAEGIPLAKCEQGSFSVDHWRLEFFIEANEHLAKIPGFERVPPKRIIDLGFT